MRQIQPRTHCDTAYFRCCRRVRFLGDARSGYDQLRIALSAYDNISITQRSAPMRAMPEKEGEWHEL